MKFVLSLLLSEVKLPLYYVYMLQQVEYDPRKFFAWLYRLALDAKPISSVMHRQKLVYTPKARLLVVLSYVFIASLFIEAILFGKNMKEDLLGLVLLPVEIPLLLALLLFIVTWVAFILIVRPNQKRVIAEATEIFANHPGKKIAVLGSYGKTSMKELLATVLSAGLDVAVTPGNMNVSVSHARFAKKLTGKEDVIVVEFGEGEPGDIQRMSQMLKPDYAIVTGLAPNHLDHYPDIKAVADDLLTICGFVDPQKLFFSGTSQMLANHIPTGTLTYETSGALGWRASKIKVEVDKTTFELQKNGETVRVSTGLLGMHQVAPVSLVVGLAIELGGSVKDVEAAIQKTAPYDHRMQPRQLHGAWIIDDTYNGNLEGMQAGLRYLADIEARRKWYVTPGLVDQGVETESVHIKLGNSIATTNPDIVVLMKNSVTNTIKEAMTNSGFSGDLRIEDKPLNFYKNIDQLIVAGDVVLMQNDWTDNYS